MKQKLLILCMAAALLLSGCGSGGGSAAGNSPAASTPSSSAPAADLAEPDWGGGSENGWEMPGGSDMPAPTEPESGPDSVYQNPDAKLIRRAELSIQTERFDESEAALKRLAADCGGYFETASVYGGSLRNANAERWGEYTVRVPAEQYSRFFNSAGDLGYVTSNKESSQDVGERYYDTEARLKTQRTKRERLLALLEKAENMEDIISLENALSDVEYQIEQYSSELNRYDALISFSTFTITLQEVGKVTREVGETASLGERMAAGFQSSLRGLVQGGQSFLIWASYHLFLVVILAAAAAAAVVVGRRELKKLRKQEEKTSGKE